MKILAAIACACGTLFAGITTLPAAQPGPATAFVGVHVIPMDRDTVLRDQTVVVREGRIVSVGPNGKTEVPAGAVRVDGAGKFLMPALAEMHAHIPGGQAPDAAIETSVVPLRGQRHRHDQGNAWRPEASQVPVARGSRRDRQPAHLHVRALAERQYGSHQRSGDRSRDRAEGGRLRPAEDPSRDSPSRVRCARREGAGTEDGLRRSRSGRGWRSARTRNAVSVNRSSRRLRGSDVEEHCSVTVLRPQSGGRASTKAGWPISCRRRRPPARGRCPPRSCSTI